MTTNDSNSDDSLSSESNPLVKTKSKIFKKMWPSFLVQNAFAFTFAVLMINIIIISTIMFPNEPFRAKEFGLMLGISTWIMGISGVLFGAFADRFSRKNLLAIVAFFYGLGYLLNGFVPAGLGMTTYYYFFTCLAVRSFFSGGIFPIVTSYANDATEEDERSQYYGAINASFQIFQIFGSLISAVVLQNNYWREYFWIVGGINMVIGLVVYFKALEPKRGATQNELKEVLQSNNAEYNYVLTKEMVKKTIMAPTNIIAFIEGIFTTILMSIPDFLLLAYVQSPPYNFSPLVITILMLVTGIPGAILGSLTFAKISDRLGKKNISNRLVLITISMVILFGIFLGSFLFPLPYLSIEQGMQLSILFQYPILWAFGGMSFLGKVVITVYNMNQPVVLQKINLPEAQGTVSSANQLLEMIGSGLGPIIAGVLLTIFNNNYQTTAIITMSVGMIGALFWIIGAKYIKKDVKRISNILKQRATELELNKNPNPISELL
ncbi:hypothetical protein NEF87_002376 [Candidatus Lokiarchaeum ossiferum]|uniref:Major facilitator superfamily (MFS) profile domain-containing protein n=1 Tax=Candidatus Lokiarchaeum ossiferum TaxID=2951803 RepID=A0ABY6HRF7_9ARCH|nr:hypothetical protein NEF87_002376 [Candidatus Lokiarchaeum sp. B-35]